MDNLELGLIGNGAISALVGPQGRILWSCMPRFDGDPVFCALLGNAEGPRGAFTVEVENFARCEQRYIRNTAILITTLHDRDGGVAEITDFAPRFKQFGRSFYPMMLVRRVRPLAGSPVIRIRIEPTFGYGAGTPSVTFGSNHIRYVSPQLVLRLTTDASIAAVLEQTPFVLDGDMTLMLGPDETVPDAPGELGQRFFGATRNYWRDWVRFLGIPFEWQEAVIRAAITIKLAALEDTGAIVAATHMFFDERIERLGNEGLFKRLEALGEMARAVYDQPDAGIWEFRSTQRVHTYSSVMCWVACDRLARIAARLGLNDRTTYWRRHAEVIHRTVCERAWDEGQGTFVESFEGKEVDASLLLLHELGFLAADDPRFAGTVAAVERRLKRGDFIFRYAGRDDFGEPKTAFLVCTFWYTDALAALGRREEARALFETLLACRNRLGLLSEDIAPDTRRLWGNFPQTYSMVGLINSAMRLSKSWEGVY